MKYYFLILMFFISYFNAFAQQKNWNEMHDFHNIMSATYHPAEEHNLQPVKDSASALVKSAKKWQSSKVPVGYNASLTKSVLAQLVSDCSLLETYVKRGESDEKLKLQITKAHETFHEIMEKCRTEKKE